MEGGGFSLCLATAKAIALRRSHGLRRAEVEHLDGAVVANLYVGGLEITMDDAELVRAFEGLDTLRNLVIMLSGKYNCLVNNTRAIAQALGRLGGQARAKRLSPAERRRIAALGGTARGRSLEVARRIADNFAYVSAMQALGGRRASPARVSTCKVRLPGLYPNRG